MGKVAGLAYKAHIAKNETVKLHTCYNNAYRLLQRDDIKARIREIRAKVGESVDAVIGFSKLSLCRWLVEIITLPAGDLDAEHDLLSRIRKTDEGKQFEMPSKMEAARLLAEICGWKSPDQVGAILAVSPTVDAALAKLFSKKARK